MFTAWSARDWTARSGVEKLGYGSMLRPSLGLPIARVDNRSLQQLRATGNQGMPILNGPGL